MVVSSYIDHSVGCIPNRRELCSIATLSICAFPLNYSENSSRSLCVFVLISSTLLCKNVATMRLIGHTTDASGIMGHRHFFIYVDTGTWNGKGKLYAAENKTQVRTH